VALPPKAFGVLCTLARQPGQLIAKDALLDAVWGHRWVSDSVLKTTSASCAPRWVTTRASRASSRPSRAGATVSWPPRCR
jgi:hypothetical protein